MKCFRGPTNEDRYNEYVGKMKPIFDKIVGWKIIKITVPKDTCGNPDDAFVLNIHNGKETKFVKVSSSEWIYMFVFDDKKGE